MLLEPAIALASSACSFVLSIWCLRKRPKVTQLVNGSTKSATDRLESVSGPSENAAFRLDTLLKIKRLYTAGAAPMVTFGSGR